MKSAITTLAQKFLIAMLIAEGAVPATITEAQIQSKLSDGNLYIKTELTGLGGITNLITSSTVEKVGTSSFDKQRLPSGTKMALEKIRLSVAVVESTDANPAAAQVYANKYADVPAKLRAAHFIITRGEKVIAEIPVSDFLTLPNVEGMVGDADCYPLDAYRYLQGDEKLEIQIKFPDNVEWPSGKKIFVSVELKGPRALA